MYTIILVFICAYFLFFFFSLELLLIFCLYAHHLFLCVLERYQVNFLRFQRACRAS